MTVAEFMEMSRKNPDERLLFSNQDGTLSIWRNGEEYKLSKLVTDWYRVLEQAMNEGKMVLSYKCKSVYVDSDKCSFPHDLMLKIINHPTDPMHSIHAQRYNLSPEYITVKIVTKEEASDFISNWISNLGHSVDGLEELLGKVEMGIYADSRKSCK